MKTLIGKLLCHFGRHKMKHHEWPLGIGKHPTCVSECERCGTVEDWAGAWDSVVCIGKWPTYEAFLKAHGREKCKLSHRVLAEDRETFWCNYCPECGEKISR